MIEKHIDEIRQMMKQGMSIRDIADRLNIHPPSLYAYFYHHREAFPKTRKYRRLSNQESELIYKYSIVDGLTQSEIADRLGVSQETVRLHMLKQIKKRSKV